MANKPNTPADQRSAKREQFVGARRRSPLAWIVPIVALVVVAAVAAILIARGGDGTAATAAPAQPAAAATGDTVTIPLSEVADGQAHFYSTVIDGAEVKYFVVKSSDGTVRAAFDACDVCYPAKKGYHQEGDVMVCNNCGRTFSTDRINVVSGGCNPAPLARTIKGGNLVIRTASMADGARYFL